MNQIQLGLELNIRYRMALKISFVLLLSFILVDLSFSAKIAGFSGLASGSHYFNIERVMEELVSRGHAVSSIKRSIINLSINSRSQSE